MQPKHIAVTANRVLIVGQIRPLESLETAGKQSVQSATHGHMGKKTTKSI